MEIKKGICYSWNTLKANAFCVCFFISFFHICLVSKYIFNFVFSIFIFLLNFFKVWFEAHWFLSFEFAYESYCCSDTEMWNCPEYKIYIFGLLYVLCVLMKKHTFYNSLKMQLKLIVLTFVVAQTPVPLTL